ncbi:hypothetical protein EJ07DRAFT_176104 [Lizonia empirigonia]|nr:hypothetical protein EJ07DRAFT_176104 [Lizonia empirigonia]
MSRQGGSRLEETPVDVRRWEMGRLVRIARIGSMVLDLAGRRRALDCSDRWAMDDALWVDWAGKTFWPLANPRRKGGHRQGRQARRLPG